MEQRAGVFIVIEGSDGSGKSTQFRLLKERLEAEGYETEVFKFPQYEQESSYFVRQYLAGAYGTADQVGPYTSSLFYALDRFEAAPRINRALAEGKVVLVDRFTGSNMAHQGTKILNAEQRRGFFIWLDNLEFEMLRVPRPNVSFILRVPADISEKLLLETGKKKDIHELDRVHLERTVLVYDDLAQLFPKDFQRIDCVRDGELLDIPTVQNLLWEKVSPLLPPPKAKKAAEQRAKSTATAALAADEDVKIDHSGDSQKQTKQDNAGVVSAAEQLLVLENASGLLVERVERFARTTRMRYPETPALFEPQNLVPDAQKNYQAKAQTLLGLHAKILAGLIKKKLSTDDARRIAGGALPVGTSAAVQIPTDDPGLGDLITNLLDDKLPELQAAGASLFAQATALGSGNLADIKQPAAKSSHAAVQHIADEYLGQNHIGQQEPVQLTSVWPRNENDLVADILYTHTGLPLRTIQERITGWPMNRKLDVLEAYLADGQRGTVLEKAHYNWDLLTPYSTFRELQRLPSEALQIQTLTPRHGYDIPKEVEDAGLADTWEKCFDLSLELYSDLQAAGHYAEAQYATLYGHNQRWKMTTNAAQLSKLPDTPTTKSMREKQAEAHPMICDSPPITR